MKSSQQLHLFSGNGDTPANPLPPWEIDDLENRKIAKVAFPSGYDAVLDYLVPNPLAAQMETGMRVLVPLGKRNRSTIGYCIDIQPVGIASPNLKLKQVESLLDDRRLLDDKMLELTRWIAQYYLCPIGQVLEAILPAGVRDNAGTRLTTVLSVAEDADKRIAEMKHSDATRQGLILTKKQLYILDTLRQSPEPLTMGELQRAAKCSAVPINTLKRIGLVNVQTIRRQQDGKQQTADGSRESVPTYQLNADQRQVLSAIVESVEQRRHDTFLLHGVTGSGKTEVYIQAIQAVVKRKRQAIVLVPEISLTPQTVGRFQCRFANVAVLHSHLTDAERHRQWSNIASGEVQVVVGARSAVFAPLPRLGLIVIDEEHENSFKQDSTPRYHAREVARKRAELSAIPLILGSATPSLESWFETDGRRQTAAGDGRRQTADSSREGDVAAAPILPSQLLSMPHRVNNLQLPDVEIVDLREEVRLQMTRGAIHRQLHQAIHETLLAKGQIILLLNRRGFSTQIQCPACGEPVKCPNCDVSLTHHKTEEIALCHYCDYQIPVPKSCPKCRFSSVQYFGFGTQKLEAEVKSRFPDAAVLRMDTDTMQGHGAHERALSQFRSGKVQILLGTQMIAKGLDFPNVTLVGVINADTALHFPDFRASERTFHLITQVAGRTGRGERGGRVIIQTYSPDHPAILAAAKHDYGRFVQQELPMRKLLGYPPYSRMIRIVVRGENEAKTLEFATAFAEKLRSTMSSGKVLGPAPAPFAKLRNYYRFHIHLRSESGSQLRESVRSVVGSLKTPPEIQWIVDVDPVDML
ncbi:MAG: primosomal protein N' [Planctomycetaceae bacterium]|jgi:primosomal protein N' (replication factor Y)|nr:primosomal protein N' [Planctomycetaceae bacterium]